MYLRKKDLFDRGQFEAALSSADKPLARFKGSLLHARKTLHQWHLQGAAAQDVVHIHAWLVDQLLHFAWDMHRPNLPTDARISLVAVGGYGRGELHPCSDVDLMLLMDRDRHQEIQGFTERFLSFLWDMGLEVGHSVRSVADCVREGKQDITVATNLMESRRISGDGDLLSAMRTRTAPPKVWPIKAFFEAKWTEQIKRHKRFGDTAYNLEPHLKDGPGALRDIQMIGWVAQRHFGSATLHELVQREFLTEEEFRTLIRSRNFLWRLRNGLHFLAGRREDRLLFDHQRSLAVQFGFHDRDGNLAVEQLMKRYYRIVKELRLLNEILLQHFQEAILSPSGARAKTINRRFRAHDGFLEVTNSQVFKASPTAMLELFLLLQKHPDLKGVRASTIRLVRENLRRIDQGFRKSVACRRLFMEILRQPHGVTKALGRMNAYGVLGAYIPVFDRVVGQMQHDLFHVYTVDAHTLFVVRNLRRFAVPGVETEFPIATEIMSRIAKPERLYLAGFFHDIGKGRGGDHSTIGERDAVTFCKLHDMSEYDCHFVGWLVRNHLLMSWTAQRQDISDPDVVLQFAQTVGDQEHLDNLYLLTVADIRGTSPHVWNTWKGRLLTDLYAATTRVLRRGFGAPIHLPDRIRDLKLDAINTLNGTGPSQQSVEQHWAMLDDEYFLRHDADSVAWHAHCVATAQALALPLVAARHAGHLGGNQVLVFAPESDDLLSIVAGGFDRLGMSIVDARIHSTRAGFALYIFVALTYDGHAIEAAPDLRDLESSLRQQILDPKAGPDPRHASVSRTLKHFPIDTRVSFYPSVNGQQTVMEVIAQDRPGLLYQVSLAMLHCKVRLVTAKITTYGERAEDIFIITDRDGKPVTAMRQQACLNSNIYRALGDRHDALPENKRGPTRKTAASA